MHVFRNTLYENLVSSECYHLGLAARRDQASRERHSVAETHAAGTRAPAATRSVARTQRIRLVDFPIVRTPVGGIGSDGAARSLTREGLGDDRVEECAVEVEPLLLGDLAVAVGIESVEEFLELDLLLAGVGVGTETLLGEELGGPVPLDEAARVTVDLSESGSGDAENLLSGGGDLGPLLLGRAFLLQYCVSR